MSDRTLRVADAPTTGLRRKKSFQGHQYRRKSKPISEQYKAELSKVLGLTVKSNCAFACSEATENIVFPAGCVIIVCQVRKKKEFHIFNPGHKSLTCIQISLDGQYIVTGESGHLPCVRVFSIAERCQVASFQSHKFGVSSVAFSPDSRYIVSVGYQHDNVINVWNWRKNELAASNKVSIKVRAVAFAEDSSYFVTVGNRHVKFWYIEQSKIPGAETAPLKGRSGILDAVRLHLFCDVGCGVGSDSKFTYVLSRTATLCKFNEKRTLECSVQLEAAAAYCMSVVNGIVVCGCGDGKVILRSSADLQLLGSFDSSDEDVGLRDIVGVRMDSNNMWVHCVGNDHSIKVWDVIDFNCPEEYLSCSFHSDCVWDVKVLPDSGTKDSLFYTCSNDSTVKLWNAEDCTSELKMNIFLEAANLPMVVSTPKHGKATGVRSLCVSEDSRLLAAGDRNGVIHIFDIVGTEHKRMAQVEMHSGDILSLALNSSTGMLASASRDRCIYILDANHSPTYTIDDHSAAVTAVKFVHFNNKLRLISCGVDKSLYFCTVENADGRVEIVRDQHIVEKHAMHDMTVVNDSVLVACGANLREYDIGTGKSLRLIRGCESVSTIIRVSSSADATIIAFSCADKFIYVLNYLSGECVLELGGHSEVCTALSFVHSVSETTLITASADSCVFAWKLTRCSKIDDGVQSCLQTLEEKGQECEDNATPENVNTTAFFGNPVLNGSLGVTHTPSTPIVAGEGVEPVEPSCTGEMVKPEMIKPADAVLDMDMSLPTWLTGEKDKVVKVRKPTGKWASRLQDEYDEVIFLDTPRTTMEWEDVNGDPVGDDDESEEEEGEESDTKNGNSESTQEAENLERGNAEIFVPASLESAQDDYEMAHQGDTSASLSTEYASAVDESQVERPSPPRKNSETSPKKFKSEVALVLNDNNSSTTDVDLKTEISSEEVSCSSGHSTVEKTVEGLRTTECTGHANHAEHGGLVNHTEVGALLTSSDISVNHTDSEGLQAPSGGLKDSHQSTPKSKCFNLKPDTNLENQPCSVEDERHLANRTDVIVDSAVNRNKDENPNIPPAFADFLQNLGKKKPRAVPTSLPVRSLYGFRNENRPRSAGGAVSQVLSQPLSNWKASPVQEVAIGGVHVGGESSSDGCQEVVDELMTAYEKAESMYRRVSGDKCSSDFDARSILSNAFSSLKDRIDRLQLRMADNGQRTIERIDVENLPPVLSLLREYSDKLCCMVTEEIRKKSVVKE